MESIDSLPIYSAVDIRNAAYEVLSHLGSICECCQDESEYKHAEKILWALNQQLERGRE